MYDLEINFQQFLKNQNEFWFMDLRLNFIANKEIEIGRFGYLVDFVENNKEKIEKLEERMDFFIQIWGNLF